MSRVTRIPFESWPPELQATTQSELGLMPILAHAPATAIAVARFQSDLVAASTLPKRLVELVRLRIAYRNQCRTCMAVRYGDALAPDAEPDAVCALEKPLDSDLLSAAEKAAILYADLMATDHLSIDDAVVERLRAHFSEAEIAELSVRIVSFIGFGRLLATMHVLENLPEDYQRDAGSELFSPWQNSTMAMLG